MASDLFIFTLEAVKSQKIKDPPKEYRHNLWIHTPRTQHSKAYWAQTLIPERIGTSSTCWHMLSLYHTDTQKKVCWLYDQIGISYFHSGMWMSVFLKTKKWLNTANHIFKSLILTVWWLKLLLYFSTPLCVSIPKTCWVVKMENATG